MNENNNLININPTQHKAVVLAMCNQKGGVGKTTTTVTVATLLAQLRYRVLVVDNDPQGNASLLLGVDLGKGLSMDDIASGAIAPGSIANLYQKKEAVYDLIVDTNAPGVHLIPSTVDLAVIEMQLPGWGGSDTRLQRALTLVASEYDVILIDCPPNLGKLVVNALTSATAYMVLVGDVHALRSVKMIQFLASTLDREIGAVGIALTMMTRTVASETIRKGARKLYGQLVFDTEIRHSTIAREASINSMPIPQYDQKSFINQDYEALVKELVERLALRPIAATGGNTKQAVGE